MNNGKPTFPPLCKYTFSKSQEDCPRNIQNILTAKNLEYLVVKTTS